MVCKIPVSDICKNIDEFLDAYLLMKAHTDDFYRFLESGGAKEDNVYKMLREIELLFMPYYKMLEDRIEKNMIAISKYCREKQYNEILKELREEIDNKNIALDKIEKEIEKEANKWAREKITGR